ncbi:hypothetical protein BDA96_08G086800 [Sorghum bicolor]|uniref:Uncharacterized protein n=2 Tax=Sorghum bicolor TaxID=4558 RepID=A0A921QF59_SORBI|nr:hypothetical protein BDA96_08G086800 [Sorghum bicolor]KAG0520584.1 hypothetical protein BDA96_08G086800 [Sorghum bicolor]OQU78976.1 hypothetical protein SORBI_3008G080801 [Sorghum bicolor]
MTSTTPSRQQLFDEMAPRQVPHQTRCPRRQMPRTSIFGKQKGQIQTLQTALQTSNAQG